MRKVRLRRPVVIGVITLAFAAAGGGAYAATQSSTSPRQAFLNDVAKRLHVSPQRLTAAVKAALVDQLNTAVKDGRLTQAQANAIKQRIEKGGGPPFPFLGAPGFGPPRVFFAPPLFFGGSAGPLAGAAAYMDLSDAQLFNDLRAGRSLAQIAKSKGKSVAGLERAMTAAIKSRLDRAVAMKLLPRSQEQQLLSRLANRLYGFIYQRGLPRPPSGLPGPPGGPPPWAPPTAPWPHHRQGSVPLPKF